MRTLGRRKVILLLLLSPYAAMLPAAAFYAPEITTEISSLAIAFHISCMILFGIGFQLGGRWRLKNVYSQLVRVQLSPVRLGLVFAIAALSVIVAVYRVSALVDFQSYISGVYLYSDVDIRAASSQLSGVEGGVSGMIKMWGGSAFGVLIGLLSVCLSLRPQPVPKGIIFLILAVVGLVVIRSLIGAERVEIFGVLTLSGICFALAENVTAGQLARIATAAVLVVIGAVVIFGLISGGRMPDAGASTYAVLYSKLGLANLSLLIAFEDKYTFGLNSLFTAVLFIVQYFSRVSIGDFGIGPDNWVYNPGQYLMGLAYLDFGLLGVILFFAIGWLIGWSLNSAVSKRSPRHFLIFLSAVYAFTSGIGMPAHRGPEFWVSVIIAFVTVHFLTRRIYRPISATDGIRRLALPRRGIGGK